MNLIKTSEISDPNSQQPFTGLSLTFLQDATKEMLAALVQSLVGIYGTSGKYAIVGCESTYNGSPGTFDFNAGYVYNGATQQIYLLEGATGVVIGSNPVLKLVLTPDGSADPCQFSDGSIHNVHLHNTLQVVDGALGSEFINYADLVFLQDQPKTKVINIGNWDMTSATPIQVAHGLSDMKKIRTISVMIRDDSDVYYNDLSVAGGSVCGGFSLDNGSPTVITLSRTSGGIFNNGSYNLTPFNRGFITITYAQ